MGGKTKTSQRTKNNVRPSSSGRSAELLNNTTKTELLHFGAVGTGKVLPALFPTLAASNIDHGLTAEYLVCFKKFNKKDPVTKVKALQELVQIVKTGNAEDAEAALPSWAHYYQFLTIDSDRRVREATQACHGALVAACGRRVAPQLRRLLPIWLLAQHDEHAPACSIAQAALQNTFPESKLPEALLFCKSEIITLLGANLSGNADAMISKRPEDSDEQELQISRVLASSLYAFELFITLLPTTHHDWLWDALAPLLQKGFFWNLARNSLQHIRAAWYGAVGRAVERLGGRFSAALGRKVALALVAEPERVATVAAQRWTALLLLMQNVEIWHTWLDKKDLLITRLLDMMENGAWGEARLLSSVLVPLLESLPADLLTKTFYINLFNAIFTGLDNKKISNSKIEREIWISNMTESLRYLSTQQQDYVVEVITYAHRTWLERVLSLSGKQTENVTRHSAANMSCLIKYWLNQSKDGNGEQYDQLARNFWQNIASTILPQIDKLSVEQEDITQLIESHHLLLKTLQKEFLQENKRKLCIQFEDQKSDDVDVPAPNITVDIPLSDTLKDRFRHNFNDVVERTCCAYFDFACKKQVAHAICPLQTNLLTDFESEHLFVALATHFKADTIYGFYDQVLKSWLAGDTMRCKPVVDVVFLVARYLSEDEQDNMFHSFQQFPPPVIEWCLSLALSHPHVYMSARRKWMRGAVAEAGVVGLCKREEDSKARSLLLMCFAHDAYGELLVNKSTAEKVVQAVSERLGSGSCAAHMQWVRLAAQLMCSLARAGSEECAELLLQALLRVRLQLASDAGSEMRDAWRDGCREALLVLPEHRRHGLLRNLMQDLGKHICRNAKEFDINHIEDAASICSHLLDNSTVISEIVSLSEHLFSHVDMRQPHQTRLQFYALRCDCLHGHIIPAFERKNEFYTNISSVSSVDHKELTKENLVISVHKMLFRAFYVRAITRNASGSDDDMSSNSWCNFLLRACHFKNELIRILYDYVVIDTLFRYYSFYPHYEIIKQTKQSLESILEEILADISIETKEEILTFFTNVTNKKGVYWTFARKIFIMKFDEVSAKICEKKKTLGSPNKSLHISSEDKIDENNDPTTRKNNYVEATKSCTIPENQLHLEDCDDLAKHVPIASAAAPSPPEPVAEQNAPASVLIPRQNESSQENRDSESDVDSERELSDSPETQNCFAGKTLPSASVQWVEILGCSTLQELVDNRAFHYNLEAEAKYNPDKVRDHKTKFMIMMRCMFSTHMYEPEVVVQLLEDIANVKDGCNPDPIINGYWTQRHLMLFDRTLTDVPWIQIMCNAAILDYLSHTVALSGRSLLGRHWDFINITLTSLLNSLYFSADHWSCTNIATLLRAVAGLLSSVHTFMTELRVTPNPSPLLVTLLEEWDDIFVPDINRHLFNLLTTVLRLNKKSITASSVTAIGSLIAMTRMMNWNKIPQALTMDALALDSIAKAAISTLLAKRHHAYKYLAFHTQQLIAKPLVAQDARKLEEWSALEEDEQRPRSCLALFDEALVALQGYTEAALSNVELCESTCEMLPFSDSHCVSLGYLLLASSLLSLCGRASGDLRHHYTVEFKGSRHAEGLMSNTLRLLPGAVAAFAHERGAALPAEFLPCFQAPPALSVYESCDGATVSALACSVLTETLGGAGGASARSWIGAAPPRLTDALRRLVPAAVTPVLLLRHLRHLRDHEHELLDTKVLIHWARGEVQSWLLMDGHELELTVSFAPEHPLVPPRVVAPPNSPVPDTSWLVKYLAYQNGTLLNALKLWGQAVSTRLQSSSQCYVCYCRLHPSTCRLPNVPCHQCGNKFHSVCLRKWFATCKRCICPLCRTRF